MLTYDLVLLRFLHDLQVDGCQFTVPISNLSIFLFIGRKVKDFLLRRILAHNTGYDEVANFWQDYTRICKKRSAYQARIVGEFAGDLLYERTKQKTILWTNPTISPETFAALSVLYPQWTVADVLKEIHIAYQDASEDLSKLVEWSTRDPMTGRFCLCLSPLLYLQYPGQSHILVNESRNIAHFFGYCFDPIIPHHDGGDLFVRQTGVV